MTTETELAARIVGQRDRAEEIRRCHYLQDLYVVTESE